MSVRLDPRTIEARGTFPLYCPYDRRVTRHARRGPGASIICVECGRPLEAMEPESAVRRSAPVATWASRVSLGVRQPRTIRERSRRLSGSTLSSRASAAPFAVALVLGAIAALTSLYVANQLFGPREALRAVPTEMPGIASASTGAASPAGAASSVRVANTEGVGAFLRRTPNLEDRLRAWPDGTPLRVVGPDATIDGIQWRPVEDPAGNQGWIPAQFTATAPL